MIGRQASQHNGQGECGDAEFPFSVADFLDIAQMLRADTGISLEQGKMTMVYARLAKRVRMSGFSDFRKYRKFLLMEQGAEGLYEPLDLGIARCRLMSAGRVGWQNRGGRIRVATKFVNFVPDVVSRSRDEPEKPLRARWPDSMSHRLYRLELSGRLDDLEHGRSVPLPDRDFASDLLTARCRERVVLCFAVVLGQTPFGIYPAAGLEPMERLIERGVVDRQHPVGALAYPPRDGIAMSRAALERAEYQEVGCTLEEAQRRRRTHWCP